MIIIANIINKNSITTVMSLSNSPKKPNKAIDMEDINIIIPNVVII